MLEFTFVFGVISLFFLLYYFKLDRDHKDFDESQAAYATPFIDRIFKFNTLAVAILSLFMMIYFSMLGDPVVITEIANNFTNFTSYQWQINGPNALNYTNQTLPIIQNYTRTTTTSFSTPQQSLINAAYTVAQYMFLLIAFLWGTSLVVKFVQAERDMWEKKRKGDYG